MGDEILTSAASGRLRTIVERIERLDEDKAALATDRKDVLAEAKGEGYDVKILNKVIGLRKIAKAKREEEESLVDTYMNAVGEKV